MIKLKEYFSFSNNKYSSKKADVVKKGSGLFPYLTPSNNYENIYKNDCLNGTPTNVSCIVTGASGEGSHTYSYMIDFPFIGSNNIHILIPKIKMAKEILIFYSIFITKNRDLFSYGRTPSKSRLSELLIPDLCTVEKLINDFKIEDKFNTSIKEINGFSLNEKEITLPRLNTWGTFFIKDLFDVYTGGDKPKKNIPNSQLVNSIENLTKNNGVCEQIQYDGKNIFSNFISVVSIGEGGKSFYQENPSVVFTRVKALIPKENVILNKYTALFLTTIIDKERFRYGYGRVVSSDKIKETKIKLPIDNKNNPDWNLIELYIKSLKFSKSI